MGALAQRTVHSAYEPFTNHKKQLKQAETMH